MWESGTYDANNACDSFLFFVCVYFKVKCSCFLFMLSVLFFHVFLSVVIFYLNCCRGAFFQGTWVTEKFISQYPPSVHNLFPQLLFWNENILLVIRLFVIFLSCWVWDAFISGSISYCFWLLCCFFSYITDKNVIMNWVCHIKMEGIYSHTKQLKGIEKTRLW